MLGYLWDVLKDILKSRLFMLCVVFAGLFSILLYRIFDLQIVNESYYMNTYVQKAVKERTTRPTRGNILDRNGNVLAYNELAYAVTIEDQLESSETKAQQLNQIIGNTIRLIEKNGDTVIFDFKLALDKDDNLYFNVTSDASKTRFLKDIYGDDVYEKEGESLERASAGEVYDYVIERYGLEEMDFSQREKLQIANIRFNLAQNAYQRYMETQIATNISQETMAAIMEHEAELTGVSITTETVRVYNDSIYFAPVIGYTGKISESQLAEFTQQGLDYNNSDIVGKAGVEASMETYLQGKKGYEQFFADSTGKILQIIEQKEAVSGNDLYLTLDRDKTIAAYHLLEQKIAGILVSKIRNADPLKEEDFDVEEDEKKPDIYVSIKDVYFQLLNNNIIDIDRFETDQAGTMEKRIYSWFKERRAQVLDRLKKELQSDSGTPLEQLDEAYYDYANKIYELLRDNGYLLTSQIDPADKTYQDYLDGKVDMHTFYAYAITSGWIDVSKLETDEKYTTAEDSYLRLVEQLIALLEDNKSFAKLIYRYMVYDGSISGNALCMILFDQKVLDMDETAYNRLAQGSSSDAYSFMVEQIRKINITPAQLALDPCSGSVVLTDPNTGSVLAMVTYPSYDNNYFSGTVDADYWAKLLDDSSDPLYNRATQTTLAPGSTFKMVSAIAGLEEGVISTDEYIYATGIYTKVVPAARCWIYPGAHGSTNVVKALGVSCNFFFYEVGYRLATVDEDTFSNEYGLERLKKYADQLGLTSKSGVEITESEPIFSTESAVRSAIGQGKHGYTAAQLARYISTLANHGTNYELTLVDRVADKNGETVYEQPPKLINTVTLSDSTWNAIRSGMEMVTAPSGTVGSVFQSLNVRVAGKTGTAQENERRLSHAVFVGYAPADDPEYAISVYIPYGDESAYSAEVARDVLKFCYGEKKLDDILKGTADNTVSGLSHD